MADPIPQGDDRDIGKAVAISGIAKGEEDEVLGSRPSSWCNFLDGLRA